MIIERFSMSIDPGSNGTGFCIWEINSHKLITWGNLYGKSKDWKTSCSNIINKLKFYWRKYEIENIYIEYPQFFPTVGGEMVAGHGSLVKLAFFVGLICGRFRGNHELIEVLKWKGQLPKEVVEKRIKEILPPEITSDMKLHTFDAVGIALHVQGRF